MKKFDAPFKGQRAAIKPEWIDYNGHLNMAYYMVLFDQCCDELFNSIGLGPDYVKQRNASYYTIDVRVNYMRELKLEDEVALTLQLIDYDDKRIHFFEHMYHAAEGWLAATMETVCVHVDMGQGKSAPWPEDIRREIARIADAHADLPTPRQMTRPMGLVRKVA